MMPLFLFHVHISSKGTILAGIDYLTAVVPINGAMEQQHDYKLIKMIYQGNIFSGWRLSVI